MPAVHAAVVVRLLYNIPINLRAFSLAAAEEVCDDFEDLKDTEFTLSSNVYIIDDILVCPFNDTDKENFFEYYLQSNNVKEALGTYFGSEYDVMIVTCEAADETVKSYIGIRQFAAEKGISYNFP